MSILGDIGTFTSCTSLFRHSGYMSVIQMLPRQEWDNQGVPRVSLDDMFINSSQKNENCLCRVAWTFHSARLDNSYKTVLLRSLCVNNNDQAWRGNWNLLALQLLFGTDCQIMWWQISRFRSPVFVPEVALTAVCLLQQCRLQWKTLANISTIPHLHSDLHSPTWKPSCADNCYVLVVYTYLRNTYLCGTDMSDLWGANLLITANKK